jgi:hypothetical protein
MNFLFTMRGGKSPCERHDSLKILLEEWDMVIVPELADACRLDWVGVVLKEPAGFR